MKHATAAALQVLFDLLHQIREKERFRPELSRGRSNLGSHVLGDLSDTMRGKYDLDAVGDYALKGVFGLHMDAQRQTAVRLGQECKSDARDE
jgi:hypothetical protein